MTALVRLGMCDLFIHGTGGANYDRAMELWINDWLGLEVGSIAVVSANLRLPLAAPNDILNVQQTVNDFRHAWHDPAAAGERDHPSTAKANWLSAIGRMPRNSAPRKEAFLAMHKELAQARALQSDALQDFESKIDRAKRQASDFAIANRRDWAFPLFPGEMIDELAAEARKAIAESSRVD